MTLAVGSGHKLPVYALVALTPRISSPKGHSGRDLLTGGAVTNIRASPAFSRADETFLAQIRCCKSPFFGPLRFILKKMDNRACRWCHVADESIPHLLQECEGLGVVGLRRTHLKPNLQDPILAGLSHEEKTGVIKFFRGLLDALEE